MAKTLSHSIKRLDLPGEGFKFGDTPEVAPQQQLNTPVAATAAQLQGEQSDNSTSSGSSSRQQQNQQHESIQSPESQQTHLVPALQQLSPALAETAAVQQHHQQPVAPFHGKVGSICVPGHSLAADGAVTAASGDLRGEPVMKSSYRGLTWDKKDGRWRVRIHFMGKQQHIGRFSDEEEAARHFDSAAYYLFGDRAVTNFGVGAAAISNIPVSSSIRALLHISASAAGKDNPATSVPSNGWDQGAGAAGVAAAGPTTASGPLRPSSVQPPAPQHSTQRQLQRQLQLPTPPTAVMKQRYTITSDPQQQQQHRPLQLPRPNQPHGTANKITVRHDHFKESAVSRPQQQQQQQSASWRPAAAVARPTSSWSPPLQTGSEQQQQQHGEGGAVMCGTGMAKPHWLVKQLQQALVTPDVNIGLGEQDSYGRQQQPCTAAPACNNKQSAAEPCPAAPDLAALATAAVAEQAAEQLQQQWQHQHQPAETCPTPLVLTSADADATMSLPEALTAVLEQLMQHMIDSSTNSVERGTEPLEQDHISEVFRALCKLQQQDQQQAAGPNTAAAGRAAKSACAAARHSLVRAPTASTQCEAGPDIAMLAEVLMQSAVTPPAAAAPAAAAGAGDDVVAGAMHDAKLVEDRLFSDLMQLHSRQRQLSHSNSSTAADHFQVRQIKRDKLKLLLQLQQQVQAELQQLEQEQQEQALQFITPVPVETTAKLASSCDWYSSPTSVGLAATTTAQKLTKHSAAVAQTVAPTACTDPHVTDSFGRNHLCAVSAALVDFFKAARSSSGESTQTTIGRKRSTPVDTRTAAQAHTYYSPPPRTVSLLAAALEALQQSAGSHAGGSSSRDLSCSVQTAAGAASPSNEDQQLVPNLQRSKRSRAALPTNAAAAIAANAAVAAAAAPKRRSAGMDRPVLQLPPSGDGVDGVGDGGFSPPAKRHCVSSTAAVIAQLLATGSTDAGDSPRSGSAHGMRILSEIATTLGLNKTAINS